MVMGCPSVPIGCGDSDPNFRYLGTTYHPAQPEKAQKPHNNGDAHDGAVELPPARQKHFKASLLGIEWNAPLRKVKRVRSLETTRLGAGPLKSHG